MGPKPFYGKKSDAILVFCRANPYIGPKLKKIVHSSSVMIFYNIFLGLEVWTKKRPLIANIKYETDLVVSSRIWRLHLLNPAVTLSTPEISVKKISFYAVVNTLIFGEDEIASYERLGVAGLN